MRLRRHAPVRRSADHAVRASRLAPRRGRARRKLAIAAVLAVLGVTAFIVLRIPSGKPIAYTAEYDEALRLSSSGQHVASLPHYARAAGRMARVWVFHFNYSSALYNAGLEVGERYATPVTRTRSSVERVQLLVRSLQEITTAESLATIPTDRATVLLARAQMLQIWGFNWDAMGPLDRAHQLDPSVEHGMAASQRAVMQHPDLPDPVAH